MMINENDFNWEQMGIGATKYDSIMKSFNNTDVSKDEAFQRRFTGFYRIRRSKEHFLKPYYEYMESLKGKNISFEEIIRKVNTFGSHSIEPSFSSKMLATLNPNMPVWDQYVLLNVGIEPPKQYSKTISKCIEIYHRLIAWYDSFLKTSESKEMRFNLYHFLRFLPNVNYSIDNVSTVFLTLLLIRLSATTCCLVFPNVNVIIIVI